MEKIQIFLILWTLNCFSRGYGHEATLKSLLVTSDIKVRYARTVVTAKYVNDNNSPAKAHFHVILPDRAYVSNFSMEMNGDISVGQVKEKEEAKQIFEKAVSQGKGAGHIKNRYTNKFEMTVNVEPNIKVVFNLTYEELLKRTQNRYKHRIFLPNNEFIDDTLIRVFITEPEYITIVEDRIYEDLGVRLVNVIDNNHVYIEFKPTIDEQEDMKQAGYDGEFVVEYKVARHNPNVVYELDGYFVHIYSPDDKPIWPANVVFMIDISGSMRDKLNQVKVAMRRILESLRQYTDHFMVGTFNSGVQQPFSGSFQEVVNFVNNLSGKGWTNINEALLVSLGVFTRNPQSTTADILFFLTDGDPTVGVTDMDKIRYNVKKANKKNVLIFTLGFGDDYKRQFLEDLAKDNNGQSRKIYIGKDGDRQIEEMFNDISKLVLKNVMITYLNSSIDARYLTPTTFKNIFAGSEIVIAGRLKQKGAISYQTTAEGPSGRYTETQTTSFDPFNFSETPQNPNLIRFEMLPNITQRTWAYVKLKNMIEEQAPRDDIVEMAIKYGFVTPYTSMVVTKKQLQGDILKEGQKKYIPPTIATTPRYIPPPTPKPTTARYIPPPTPKPTTALRPMVPPSRKQGGSGSQIYGIVKEPLRIAPTYIPYKILKINPVLVKPYKCDLTLCMVENMVCRNTTKVLLLRDKRADVEIYSYPYEDENCMQSSKKITIQSRRKKVELTPSFAIAQGRRIDLTKRNSIDFKFKRFFRLNVVFNRIPGRPTLLLKFIVLNEMFNAVGLYSEYMKNFDCMMQSPKEVTLSHMNRKFKQGYFIILPDQKFDCYMRDE